MRRQFRVVEKQKNGDEDVIYAGGDGQFAKKTYDDSVALHPDRSYIMAYLSWIPMYHNK